MVAVRNFLPEDPALLAFHKGDIIHLQPLEPPRLGQHRGGGRGVSVGAAGRGLPRRVLTWAWPAGYSAGCVVGKKVVYLEELRCRGPDFGGYPGAPLQLPEPPDLETPNRADAQCRSCGPQGSCQAVAAKMAMQPSPCPHIRLTGLRGH